MPAAHPWEKQIVDGGTTKNAFSVTIAQCNTTVAGRDLLNVPTAIVIEMFRRLGPIGYLAGVSYDQEGKRSYKSTLRPPPGYEDYLHCGHRDFVWSANKAKSYGWSVVEPNFGIYRWEMDKSGWFKGRGWFKANLLWIARHPKFTDFSSQDIDAIARHVNSLLK